MLHFYLISMFNRNDLKNILEENYFNVHLPKCKKTRASISMKYFSTAVFNVDIRFSKILFKHVGHFFEIYIRRLLLDYR